eukprot:3965525-Prymnesium_polylepis.2
MHSPMRCACCLVLVAGAGGSYHPPRPELIAERNTLAGVNAEAAASLAAAAVVVPPLTHMLTKRGNSSDTDSTQPVRRRRNWLQRLVAFLTDTTTQQVLMTMSIYWMAFVSWQVNRDRVLVRESMRDLGAELGRQGKRAAKAAVKLQQDAGPVAEAAAQAAREAAIAAQ